MNKFLVSSNVVLIVAVIILFCLYFGKNSNNKVTPITVAATNTGQASGFKIGYFELDSLDNNYKYEQDVKNDLMSQDKDFERQINELQNEVRDKIEEAQKKGPTLSQAEQTNYSNEINELTRQNQDKAQRLQQSMSMERNTKLQQVKLAIQNYLKTYAKDNGYNYIIGTYDTDNFYYKDSAQDITVELVQKLNQIYSDSLKNVKN